MELFRRIWYLLNRRRLQREMADEMAYHRELMPVDRQREFGNDLRLLRGESRGLGLGMARPSLPRFDIWQSSSPQIARFHTHCSARPGIGDRRASYGFPSAPLRLEGQWCA